MLHFLIFEQTRQDAAIHTYDGTADLRDQLHQSVSEQLTWMYQYQIYEEGISWQDLSCNMTEQEFQVLFNQGQRLFFLETPESRFVIKIEDYDTVRKVHEEKSRLKDQKILFDDLQVYCANFINGSINLNEFKLIVNAYEKLNVHNNKDLFDSEVCDIEKTINNCREDTWITFRLPKQR